MPDVAVVTDTTHYLPARDSSPSSASTRSASTSTTASARSARPTSPTSTAFYDAPAHRRPTLPTTSQPSIGDFLAVYEPLVARRAATSSRSTSRAGSRARSRPRARPRPSSTASGARIEVIDSQARLRRARHGRARHRRRGARAGADVEAVAARAREAAGRHAPVVRGRHAGVPAARRAHRRRAGLAGRRAEDQADPHLRRRDHPDRARAHRRAGPSSAWSTTCARATRTAPTAGSSSTSRRPTSAERLVASAGARSSAASRCSCRRSGRSSAPTSAPGLVGVGGIPLALLDARDAAAAAWRAERSVLPPQEGVRPTFDPGGGPGAPLTAAARRGG